MLDWTDFNKMDSEQWMAKANEDLKGKKVASDFNINIENDFIISPFLTEFSLKSTQTVLSVPTKSAVFIKAQNCKEGNIKALQFLNLGAVFLIIDIHDEVYVFDDLFKDIHLQMIGVILKVGKKTQSLSVELKTYLALHYGSQKMDIVIIEKEENILDQSKSFKDRISKFGNISKESQNSEITIVQVGIKNNFYGQVSELRALRNIWTKTGNDSDKLFILAVINDETTCSEDVHPLIASNYMLMSSYLGMSNAAVLMSDEMNPEQTRLNLNIQHIFKEESYLSTVIDPLGGAYIIEALTDQMTCLVI